LSHVATIDVHVTSLEALKRACNHLGLQLRLGQKTYTWFGRWINDYGQNDAAYKHGIKPEDYGKCEHAITNPRDPSGYEIGLHKNPNGPGWIPVVDFWGASTNPSHIANLAGHKCERLVQEYSTQLAMMNAQHLTAEGYQLQRQVTEDGAINLVYEKVQ
jgi:hypothetical protein